MRRALYFIATATLAIAALAVTQYVLGHFFPVEGVAIAFLGGLFGGGSKTTTTTLDPATQQYVDWSRGITQQGVGAIGGMGPLFAGPNAQARAGMGQIGGLGSFAQNPWMQQYMQGNQGLLGQLGVATEAFGPGAIETWMDPYRSDVIGGINQAFDRSGQVALNAAQQQATGAGAYGGSRLGVMQGIALAENERNRNQQVGGALSQGYNQAVQNWMANRQMAGNMGLAGLGGMFSGAQYGNQWDLSRGQANMQAGEYARQLQERMMQEPLYRQQMMTQMANAGVGPYGTTSTEKSSGSLLGGLLGLGMLGNVLIPGLGTGISQLGSALGLGGNIMGGTL